MNAAAGRGNVNSIQAASKYKQQISNLQNQISAQQAIYMKQQQQQQNPHVDFLRNHQDPIASLQNNFSDMAVNKDQHNPFPNTSQQSRLNQWKLPNTLPSDDSNEFGKSATVMGLQSEGYVRAPRMSLVLQNYLFMQTMVLGQERNRWLARLDCGQREQRLAEYKPAISGSSIYGSRGRV